MQSPQPFRDHRHNPESVRTVNVLRPNSHKVGRNETIKANGIRTSKYTWYNFLPKNLLIQFSKTANVFYLFIAFLQVIPLITITGGRPVMLIPLSVVILISMIKDIFEDSKRHKSDNLENRRRVMVYNTDQAQFIETVWHKLKVGDIVRIRKNEYLPADVLLLRTSEVHGTTCYVETKNLDGETNLKTKKASTPIYQLYSQHSGEVSRFEGWI